MKKIGGGFLLIFGLIWTLIVGGLDAFFGYNLYRQIRSAGFPSTTGVVLSSEVTHSRGSKGGTTYGVNIQYSYEVAKIRYEGNTYRYTSFSSSNSRHAYEAVRNHPAGKTVKVYYNPENPQDSLLRPGMDGDDLFILMFLTPFNLVMLGILSVPVFGLWRRLRKAEAGGVKWRVEERRIRVRLPRFSPLVGAFLAFGVVSFVSIFIMAFGMGGHPSLNSALIIWAIIIFVAMDVFIWLWISQAGGKSDLVIDPDRRVVELPATFGRSQRQIVPISDLAGVDVELVETKTSKGGTTQVYVVNLQHNDGAKSKLAEWWDEKKAEEFAVWLRQKLGLEENAAPPPKLLPRMQKPA
jgi:amino acid transporter